MKESRWYLKGLLLGLVFFVAIWWVKPIGVSTQYSVASGKIQSFFEPGLITADRQRESGVKSTNAYYDKNEGKIAASIADLANYDFIFVVAIPVGAFVGFLLVKQTKRKKYTSYLYRDSFRNSMIETERNSLRTYGLYFLSGFLLLFGARMADGCTSGHMMSGMMQGSISGYLFAASVFVIAIPTAMLTKGLWRERK